MGIIEKVKKAAEVAGEKGKRVAATTGIVFTMAATGVGCSKTPAPQAATEATTDAAEIAAEAEQAAADATAAEAATTEEAANTATTEEAKDDGKVIIDGKEYQKETIDDVEYLTIEQGGEKQYYKYNKKQELELVIVKSVVEDKVFPYYNDGQAATYAKTLYVTENRAVYVNENIGKVEEDLRKNGDPSGLTYYDKEGNRIGFVSYAYWGDGSKYIKYVSEDGKTIVIALINQNDYYIKEDIEGQIQYVTVDDKGHRNASSQEAFDKFYDTHYYTEVDAESQEFSFDFFTKEKTMFTVKETYEGSHITKRVYNNSELGTVLKEYNKEGKEEYREYYNTSGELIGEMHFRRNGDAIYRVYYKGDIPTAVLLKEPNGDYYAYDIVNGTVEKTIADTETTETASLGEYNVEADKYFADERHLEKEKPARKTTDEKVEQAEAGTTATPAENTAEAATTADTAQAQQADAGKTADATQAQQADAATTADTAQAQQADAGKTADATQSQPAENTAEEHKELTPEEAYDMWLKGITGSDDENTEEKVEQAEAGTTAATQAQQADDGKTADAAQTQAAEAATTADTGAKAEEATATETISVEEASKFVQDYCVYIEAVDGMELDDIFARAIDGFETACSFLKGKETTFTTSSGTKTISITQVNDDAIKRTAELVLGVYYSLPEDYDKGDNAELGETIASLGNNEAVDAYAEENFCGMNDVQPEEPAKQPADNAQATEATQTKEEPVKDDQAKSEQPANAVGTQVGSNYDEGKNKYLVELSAATLKDLDGYLASGNKDNVTEKTLPDLIGLIDALMFNQPYYDCSLANLNNESARIVADNIIAAYTKISGGQYIVEGGMKSGASLFDKKYQYAIPYLSGDPSSFVDAGRYVQATVSTEEIVDKFGEINPDVKNLLITARMDMAANVGTSAYQSKTLEWIRQLIYLVYGNNINGVVINADDNNTRDAVVSYIFNLCDENQQLLDAMDEDTADKLNKLGYKPSEKQASLKHGTQYIITIPFC